MRAQVVITARRLDCVRLDVRARARGRAVSIRKAGLSGGTRGHVAHERCAHVTRVPASLGTALWPLRALSLAVSISIGLSRGVRVAAVTGKDECPSGCDP